MNATPHRARPLTTALALLVLLTCAVFVATPWNRAEAAEITGPIKNVTVTPADGNIDDDFNVDMDWCVPDGSHAGDTFTMTLPRELDVRVTGFDLNTPTEPKQLVARASIARRVGDNGQVVTFTLTDYVESHNNVCGAAWFRSWYDQSEIQAGDTTQLHFQVGDQVIPVDVTPTASADEVHLETKADKWGYWLDEAETRAGWEILSPSAPDGSWANKDITVSDDAPAGMTFDCSRVRINIGHDWGYWRADTSQFTLHCSPTHFDVTYNGPLKQDEYFYVKADTVVKDTAADRSLEKYTNTAGVQYPGITAPVPVSDYVERREDRDTAEKAGKWVDTNDQTAIRWTIRTPDAPAAGWSGGAKIVDHAQTGLTFDCSSLKVQLVTQRVGVADLNAADLGTCSATDLNLSYTSALTEGQWLRVEVVTNAARGQTAYNNTADVTVGGREYEAQATQVQRSDAGGHGSGDVPQSGPTEPGPGTGNGESSGTPGSTETPGTGTGTGTGAVQPQAPAQAGPQAPAQNEAEAPVEEGPLPEVLPNTGGPQLALLLAGLALVAGGAGVVLRNRKVAN